MFAIETERLILRDFSTKDADDYVSLTQDAKYQRFYSEEDCEASKSRMLVELFSSQALEQPRTKFQLAIELKTTKQMIGTCGVRLEESQQALMGCGVGRKFQGSGYAREAAEALIAYGFKHLNIHRLYAETIGANKAAIMLCQQMGMAQEAHFVERRYFKQKWWDTVVYAIRKTQWEERQIR